MTLPISIFTANERFLPCLMKWYKKQLDALKKKTAEEKTANEKETLAERKKTSPSKGYLDAKKTRKNTFSSPVAQRNINRPKTDLY